MEGPEEGGSRAWMPGERMTDGYSPVTSTSLAHLSSGLLPLGLCTGLSTHTPFRQERRVPAL